MNCNKKNCPFFKDNSLQMSIDYSRNSMAILLLLVKELTGKDMRLLMSKKNGAVEYLKSSDYLGAEFTQQKDSL